MKLPIGPLVLAIVLGFGFLCVHAETGWSAKAKAVRLAAEDGLEVTGDLYLARKDPKTPMIILCHQAGWSRGEYREIAPKLNSLGFNCLAIDQRSGKGVNGVNNETASRAKAADKGTEFVDAIADIRGAVKHCRKKLAKGKLILWGSSYSAALVLRLAGKHPDLVDGVLSFAPGEYFRGGNRSKTWIREGAEGLKCPVFVTSARNEHANWKAIFEAIPSKTKVAFLPKAAGQHGSRALWEKFDEHKEYWVAVRDFLKSNFLSS